MNRRAHGAAVKRYDANGQQPAFAARPRQTHGNHGRPAKSATPSNRFAPKPEIENSSGGQLRLFALEARQIENRTTVAAH
jgi:hypothetical protein